MGLQGSRGNNYEKQEIKISISNIYDRSTGYNTGKNEVNDFIPVQILNMPISIFVLRGMNQVISKP
jgi:hypothetical protein